MSNIVGVLVIGVNIKGFLWSSSKMLWSWI